MNNEEPDLKPNLSPDPNANHSPDPKSSFGSSSEPIPPSSPDVVPDPANAWVPQKEYSEYKNQAAADTKKAQKLNARVRVFYTVLAIGGLMIAVAFIGSLIAPSETTPGRGSPCTHSDFEGIQFFLNFFGFIILLITGAFGASTAQATVRKLGFTLIVLSLLLGSVAFLFSVSRVLCGV